MELVLILFGGGVSGFWLLDEALRRGYRALLLEGRQLGHGQTAASQGIIHSGFKYVFGGSRKRSKGPRLDRRNPLHFNILPLVEPKGLEPSTSALRTQRSPN